MTEVQMAKRYLLLLLTVCVMVSLTSCYHTRKKDGPPNFYVDETRIPNATPKPERLAKYGNMRSYVVWGKRYYVMKSSKHYDKVGTASWYGTAFHGRRASNGERYNMLSMTAAHKTLPLPTYVRVTNLRNHREVIVKVTDRGPFAQNDRLIDVSYVAAKKLGMIGQGTARVRVTAIDPYTYGNERLYFSKDKPFYLQVGAFRSRTHAKQYQQRISSLLSTDVNISKPPRSKLYHVQIGPMHDPVKAKQIANRLQELGIKANKRVGA
jgi:rare lipoprotein A